MKYWIIEHKTKGYYVGHDVYGENPAYRPRFRWSIQASHDDVEKVYSEEAARTLLKKVQRDVPGVTIKGPLEV